MDQAGLEGSRGPEHWNLGALDKISILMHILRHMQKRDISQFRKSVIFITI